MFFIGIFGVDNKERVINESQNIYCKGCNKYELGKVIKKYSFFHFFFIPLFKWNEQYYVIYNECNHIYGISKEKGKRIEGGEKIEINYWDLKDLDGYSYNGGNICINWGRKIEEGFVFCPYCGEKLK